MLPRPTARRPGQPEHTGGFNAASHECLPRCQEFPVLRRDHDVVLRVPSPVTALVDVEPQRCQIHTYFARHLTHSFSPRFHRMLARAGECDHGTMAIANITIVRVATTPCT